MDSNLSIPVQRPGIDFTPASGSESLQLGESGGFGRLVTNGIMEFGIKVRYK
jgi:hypothetical protein